ncbi:MAG: CRISPR-associated helicase Cas3' [Myxococcales bacterium]|nr:CRISPR-associated helicase Cas3' [Myxococcales bacterium]
MSGPGIREALDLFSNHEETPQLVEALPEALGDWAPECKAYHLLFASICHHGKPVRIKTPVKLKQNWSKGPFGDPFAGVASLASATRAWFPRAYADGSPLPSSPAFQHAFAGLVMLADWLGSDTKFFPYTNDGDAARIEYARSRARQALEWLGLDTRGARQTMVPPSNMFSALLPEHTPRPLQQAVLEPLMPTDEGCLVALEAETGSGKTEAALAWFLRLLHAGHVDGLYFALPTRSAATQIHRRVYEAVCRVFPDAATRPPVTLAVPGYLRVDALEGRHLPGFEVLWNDNGREHVAHRTWSAEHPKRYLAGAVVIGTIDQVLLSTLTTSHAHLRSTSLLRHLLVVDEVHASDAYMTRLLDEVLRHHLKAGGHALLMSATLGTSAHSELFSAACGHKVACPRLEQAIHRPYPLLSFADRGAAPTLLEIESSGRERDIALEVQPLMSDVESVARRALVAARAGARVLVIRNTVRGCVETQEELERLAQSRDDGRLLFRCEGVVAPHHSRFAKEDRIALDKAIERAFGKLREGDHGCVVVATQTVEQSLDIDADFMMTDLCPVDVLLQRLGRLHRHERARPRGFEIPNACILVPTSRDLTKYMRGPDQTRGPHGVGSVYRDLVVLEATWQLLERRFELSNPHRQPRAGRGCDTPRAAGGDRRKGRRDVENAPLWRSRAHSRRAPSRVRESPRARGGLRLFRVPRRRRARQGRHAARRR